MQGMAWDWQSAAHRALDNDLLSALHQIHQLGVLHGDLHAGNIVVTPENRVVVLDFDGARLQAPANELTAEQDHVAMLLAMQVGSCVVCRAPACCVPVRLSVKLGLQRSLSLWSGFTYRPCSPALKMCLIRRCTCTDTPQGRLRVHRLRCTSGWRVKA